MAEVLQLQMSEQLLELETGYIKEQEVSQ